MSSSPAHATALKAWRCLYRSSVVRLVLTCTAVITACGGEPAQQSSPPPRTPAGRGIARATTTATTTTPVQVTEPPSTAPQGAGEETVPTSTFGSSPTPSDAPSEVAVAPTDPEQARDYAAELSGLLGSPASCLGPRPFEEALKPVTIEIAAQVMPSGAVGRVEVRAATLSPAELQCVQRLVAQLRLRGPIEGAPRGLQTRVTLQPQAAAKKPPPKAAALVDNKEPTEVIPAEPTERGARDIDREPPQVPDVQDAPAQERAPADTTTERQPSAATRRGTAAQ